MSVTKPIALERTSLEAHVDLCAERYEQLDNKLGSIDERFEKIDSRFDKVEAKLTSIEIDHKKGNTQIIVGLIAATATIIAAVIGAITMLVK
jgi:predicted nuclease with TOPRIM domain